MKKTKKETCDNRTYNINNKYLNGDNYSQKEINWNRRKWYGKNSYGKIRRPNWKLQKCKKQWMANFKLEEKKCHYGTYFEYRNF